MLVSGLVGAGACTGQLGESQAAPGAGEDGHKREPGQGPASDGDPANADDPLAPPSDDPIVQEACMARSLPSQPLRRLSSTQYDNTLRDLFGAQLAEPLMAGSLFPVTRIASGFINDAEANLVNTSESNAIEDNAERIAAHILSDPAPYVTGLMPCNLDAGYREADVDACIGRFIEGFGQRAYRRPLTSGERDIAQGLYDSVRESQTADEAFAAVVQLFVQAPALLYRVERGAGEAIPGLVRLSDYEMASRLSYFFVDSMPDDTLFAAAAAGELSTRAQIAAQAERLMQDPRLSNVVDGFHRDWLRLYALEDIQKDAALYPAFTPEVRDALQQEASRFVRYVMEEADGNVATLLGSQTIPINGPLADFYGVSVPDADADTWVPASLPDRQGILTLASFMATQADTDRTSPIHRGAFFQKEVLCNALPAFPGNVDVQSPLQDTSGLPTARERLAPLLENATCAGCHTLFNPTGLALENYDAAGQWRDQEGGADIDATGMVTLDGETVAFQDALGLIEAVAESQQAQDCYTLQWFRKALGRREFQQDACSLAYAGEQVADAGGDIRALLLALTQTDAFMYRQKEDLLEDMVEDMP